MEHTTLADRIASFEMGSIDPDSAAFLDFFDELGCLGMIDALGPRYRRIYNSLVAGGHITPSTTRVHRPLQTPETHNG